MAFIFNLPRIDENTPKETLISYLKQMNEQLTYAMNLLDDRTVALSSAIGVDEDTIESGSSLIKKINMCANEIAINGDRVNIAGDTTINEVFYVGTDGKIIMHNCALDIDTSSESNDIIKLNSGKYTHALMPYGETLTTKDDDGNIVYNFFHHPGIWHMSQDGSIHQITPSGMLIVSGGKITMQSASNNTIQIQNLSVLTDANINGKLSVSGDASANSLSSNGNMYAKGSVSGSSIVSSGTIEGKGGQIRLGASGWTDSSKMPLVSFYDDNVDGWRHLASVSKRSDGNYRMQFGVTASSLDNSAKGYIGIGHATYTSDISINAKNNIDVIGNLVLKGSTRGTFDITTSNKTLRTFSASYGGQTWLLNLNNSSNGASTYLVSIASSGVGLTKIAEKVSGVTPTLSLNTSNQFQILVKGNASVTVNYSWTRIF